MERYADCPSCAGMGKVRDAVLLQNMECARCDGTGVDGSVAAWTIRDQNIEQMKENWPREQNSHDKRDDLK